eukprot:COSAG04_NODE_3287_length_2971_cov_10.541086_4_plen_174_part_00
MFCPVWACDSAPRAGRELCRPRALARGRCAATAPVTQHATPCDERSQPDRLVGSIFDRFRSREFGPKLWRRFSPFGGPLRAWATAPKAPARLQDPGKVRLGREKPTSNFVVFPRFGFCEPKKKFAAENRFWRESPFGGLATPRWARLGSLLRSRRLPHLADRASPLKNALQIS